MSNAEKTIFISYRRSVSSFIARAVFMDLRAHGYDVFMDVDSMDSGAFDTIILNQIAARMHFLLILTPGTLERCAESGDWLHREIEHAMDLGRNIVPVTVNEFKFKDYETYLTGKLAQLPRLNALPLYHEYFDAGMEKLRGRFLKSPQYGPIFVTPTPPQERAAVEEKIEAVVAQTAPTPKQLSAEEYFAQGYAYFEAGNYNEAVTAYAEAIRLSPNYAVAYNNRGLAYKAKGNLKEAIADYDRAIDLDPKFYVAYYNRGNAYKTNDKDRPDRAIADYSKCIALNPKYVNAYHNRGCIYYANGDRSKALSDFNDVIRLDPQNALAYYYRGVSRHNQDPDGAISDYNTAINLNAAFADAYYNRAVLYEMRKKNPVAAIDDLEEYIKCGGGQKNGNQLDVEQRIHNLKQKLER